MVPLYGRYIAAAVGLFLVVIDCISLVGTLIVPRPVGGRLMIWVDRLVHAGLPADDCPGPGAITGGTGSWPRRPPPC